jgi:hypothetical protein
MAGANANQQNNQPWMVLDVVAVPGAFHQLLKHPKKFLPKFDPDKKGPVEDHIKKFMLVFRLIDVEHEYVICRLFPDMFENKDST